MDLRIRKEYDRTLCKKNCSKANPLGVCHCKGCSGEKHGSGRVTPEHLFTLADKKLHDPKITDQDEEFWLGVMSLTIKHHNRKKLRRAA